MFRTLRIGLLLFVLATVAVSTWRAQSTVSSWKRSLIIGIYPIDADGRATTADYLATLERERFQPIEEYVGEQARTYGLPLRRPVMINLARPLSTRPPLPPERGSMLDAILWSLQMRFWAWRNDDIDGPRPDIRIFVRYHDPIAHPAVGHSVGLEKGHIGLVNAFASRYEDGGNSVIIAHELMHTLGASDKYDPLTLQPRFPDGYGDPRQSPLLPQRRAEIMGGRIALSRTEAAIPRSLSATLVGPGSAREIGWIRD